MLAENKRKTNIGVGVGFVLQIIAHLLIRPNAMGDPTAPVELVSLGFVLMVIGFAFFIWGCMNYEEGKGFSKHIGWLGLLRLDVTPETTVHRALLTTAQTVISPRAKASSRSLLDLASTLFSRAPRRPR